ncbi:MAG TPA: LacI family DNA-binding transcriptional regulator [Chitinophagaceae bacterium]|jgi:LacI family transcriptional regulator
MANVTIKKLAQELNLSVGTVSKALKDSHEISVETKRKVHDLVNKLNYVPNPYASSLRKRKSRTIAVVLPEVADSFFSLAINGIEAVAQEKGYHVLIYLTHESFSKEENILKDFKSGRVDGILISVSRETTESNHIRDVQTFGIPIVFFDRVCEEVETANVTTNDFESGYVAAKHLVERGCRQITYLSISSTLSIANKRMEGYYKVLSDHGMKMKENGVLFCTNNEADNYRSIKNLMNNNDHPDGLIASVEKLTITVYHVCKDLDLRIPEDVKVISFSNLASALILNPSLTTITQPAFEMGEAAASLLFKALEKRNYVLKDKNVVVPSVLNVRDSTNLTGTHIQEPEW